MTAATEALGAEIMARIDELAALSESPDGLTRRYLTPEHRQANDLVGQWMRDAGMTARGPGRDIGARRRPGRALQRSGCGTRARALHRIWVKESLACVAWTRFLDGSWSP
jgi:hypothetical protein